MPLPGIIWHVPRHPTYEAGVPRALILRLNRDIHQVPADADTRTQLLPRGLEPAATTPEEFALHIGAEIARWSKVIRESGIRAE